MTNRLYAMDTHFWGANKGPDFPEQARMVKAAGYDDYYMTGSSYRFAEFTAFKAAVHAAGLGINAINEGIDIKGPPDTKKLDEIEAVLRELTAPARLEISMTYGSWKERAAVSDARKDDRALAWLERLAGLLDRYGLECSLYPHRHFYLETFSDALRLADKLNHPRVGAIFCGFHWFAVRREPGWKDLFAQAGRRLNAVNLSGSRDLPEGREAPNGMNPSIEPLDAGTVDNAAILRELRRLGFRGPVGVQGFAVNAPPAEALERSMRVLRSQLG